MDNIQETMRRMEKTLAEWDMDEPRSDWWQYQHDYAECYRLISGLTDLVIAGREAFDAAMLDCDQDEKLDKALERYADDVPYNPL